MTKTLRRISAWIVLSNLFLATVSFAAQDTSFEAWLEQYGAWDRLEQEYAAVPSGDTPETILKRAQVYLNLNSPKQALEIIEMSTAFEDNATEAQRLFLGGKAHRALGDLSKSVLWFTQSAKFIHDPGVLRRNFRQEPEMETVWADVWTEMYWSYLSNYTLSRDAQLDALNQILTVGRTVWNDEFWEKATAVLNPVVDNATQAAFLQAPAVNLGPDGLPLPPFVSKSDEEAIVSSMAMVSLEKFEEARVLINTIAQPPVREFWLMVVNFLETGAEPAEISVFLNGNYLKAYAFWAGNVLAPYSGSRASWLLGNPDSAPWKKFRNKLLSMPLADANKAIDNELGSMLISEDTATLLNSFKLALSLSDGDFSNSTTTWNKIDKRGLPWL